ncbi:hypothetical protein A7P96_09265 [Eikenella sp. NML03-A-027]|nr:hypothetical protein A7P96_09265 [Eikenella sp. NML03-A-027]
MKGWDIATPTFGLNFRNKHSQVVFIFVLYLSLRFMPARALNLATQKQTLLQRSCFNFVKTNPSNEGFVFASQKLAPLRRPRFLCFAKERKQRKATAGTGLASPNFPHCTRFFGRKEKLD